MQFHRWHPVAINLFPANGQMDTQDEDISCFCTCYVNVSKNRTGCNNTKLKCRYVVHFRQYTAHSYTIFLSVTLTTLKGFHINVTHLTEIYTLSCINNLLW
jgi:hypothetical protein